LLNRRNLLKPSEQRKSVSLGDRFDKEYFHRNGPIERGRMILADNPEARCQNGVRHRMNKSRSR
jgi:hypothetical protein